MLILPHEREALEVCALVEGYAEAGDLLRAYLAEAIADEVTIPERPAGRPRRMRFRLPTPRIAQLRERARDGGWKLAPYIRRLVLGMAEARHAGVLRDYRVAVEETT